MLESTGTLQADRSRLLSILENLFRNNIDHGGTDVTCRVGLTDAGFYVADDGPGIQPDKREQIFEYGYSGSDDGSGLGLTIAETMTSAHGWELSVSESEDGGARFVVDGAAVSLEAV